MNWSTDLVPGAADDVTIQVAGDVVGNDTLAGQFTFTATVPNGRSYDRTAPVRSGGSEHNEWPFVFTAACRSASGMFERRPVWVPTHALDFAVATIARVRR